MLRMPYPEVKKVNGTITDARDGLLKLGFSQIGYGSNAWVYANDNHVVVKIGFVNTDNYLNYVRMVGLQSQNPHLPYIHSVDVFDRNPDTPESAPYYVVMMERLRLEPNTFHSEYWKKMGIENPGSFHQDKIETAKPKTSAMNEVKKILTHMYQCYNARYDVCLLTANVMWRGKTAVFTDPVV